MRFGATVHPFPRDGRVLPSIVMGGTHTTGLPAHLGQPPCDVVTVKLSTLTNCTMVRVQVSLILDHAEYQVIVFVVVGAGCVLIPLVCHFLMYVLLK